MRRIDPTGAFKRDYKLESKGRRQAIAKLTPSERHSLIGDLWDSITDTELPVLPTQRRELLRRLANFDEDRTQAVTWEHLKAELAARTP